ncbi:MAG: chemotaxis protein CheX [Desulfobacteraceae bacterium]|nr:chemotaxis protein CheX [Desulfobacteraceae bacterium]
MKTNLMTAMKTSISEVMESMFYLPVEISHADTMAIGELISSRDVAGGRLEFTGPCSGSFSLFVPRDLLTVMTENFMGEPRKTLSVEHFEGVLKECLNMIAGNTLRSMADASSYDLHVPDMVEPGTLPATNALVQVETMDGTMVVTIELD